MQYKDTFLKSNKSHIYSHQIANCTGRNSVNIKQNPDLNSRLAEHKPDTLTNGMMIFNQFGIMQTLNKQNPNVLDIVRFQFLSFSLFYFLLI